MKGFDPARSFGAAVAASYDDALRGDEGAAVQFYKPSPPTLRHLNLLLAQGASPCP